MRYIASMSLMPVAKKFSKFGSNWIEKNSTILNISLQKTLCKTRRNDPLERYVIITSVASLALQYDALQEV
jgi:hypothetical protein